MKRRIVCLAAAAVLTVAGSAWAGNQAGVFSVSPFFGGYIFDGVEHQEMSPTVGLRAGYNFTKNLGAEGAFGFTSSDGTKNDSNLRVYNYNLDVLYHFIPDSQLVPFVAAGFGGRSAEYEAFDKMRTRGAFNYGAGVKYFLTDEVAFRGDVRHLIFKDDLLGQVNNQTLHNVEYSVGISFLFGAAKPAPAPVVEPKPAPVAAPAPAPKPAPVAAPPAPEASLAVSPGAVTKGEAVTLTWACKNSESADIQPGIGKVPPQGSRTLSPADSTDYVLTCSSAAGAATSAATVGVTQPAAPVATLTAVPAAITKGGSSTLEWACQNATAADIQPDLGTVQLQGTQKVSPEGSADYTLTCSGAGGKATSNAKVSVTEQLCIKLEVEFDTAKADIKKKYHAEIGKVAEFLKTYPDATGTIEGHTDNVGGADYNLKLSQRRADAVMTYLIEKYGIAKGRLSAKGFGLTKPIADNKTAAGRQKNRRILATFDCVIPAKKK